MTTAASLAEAVRRARTLAGIGRTAEAAVLAEEILAEDPKNLGALLLKSSLRAEDRDFAAALALVECAAQEWPRSAEALNALARCLHALGRDEEALVFAERARAVLDEGDNHAQAAAVYLTIVWCLREMRRFREAIAAAEEGLARTPDAILAQWATQVEDEMAEAETERC